MQSGGLSDGNEGVQWNAGYDMRDGFRWLGVNLEGLKYHDWPVARLIRRELDSPTLPDLIRRSGTRDSVAVWWVRDYWQAASRPEITERLIAPTPISASRLTEERWLEALEGAAGCLAPSWDGRASQEVTLVKSSKRLMGKVSPHLTISVSSDVPVSWLDFLKRGKVQLQPFYDWAVERAA